MTARALADLNGVALSYARRALRLWAQAGYLARVEPEGSARDAAATYAMRPGAPGSAPAISADDEVEPREPAMSAAEFAAIRRLSGLGVRAFGVAIGLKGHPNSVSREIRRYETDARPIGAKLAASARALASGDPLASG